MEGRKRKKPTKAQMIESIPKVVEDNLKKNYIKNMIEGYQIANQMILDYINDGHNLDEVKSFCEKNVSEEGLEAMRNATK